MDSRYSVTEQEFEQGMQREADRLGPVKRPQTTETQEQPVKAGIILERHHLAAAAFAGGEKGRYSLTGVNVKPDGTVEATNGHYAIRVPASRMSGAEFPTVDGMGAELSGPVMVPADTFKSAEKALPRKCSIPILRCAYVGNGGGSAKVTTTDLETPIVRTAPQTGSKFPDLDQVTPKTSEESLRIGLNAEYMRTIADYALKAGKTGRDKRAMLELVIPNPETAGEAPVMFRVTLPDEQQATIVLMPMRLK